MAVSRLAMGTGKGRRVLGGSSNLVNENKMNKDLGDSSNIGKMNKDLGDSSNIGKVNKDLDVVGIGMVNKDLGDSSILGKVKSLATLEA